jgi:hypothetical protein
MGQEVFVAHTGNLRNAYKISVGKSVFLLGLCLFTVYISTVSY